MNLRRAITAGLLLLVTFLLWWRTKPPAATPSPAAAPAATTTTSSGVGLSVTQSTPPPERSTLADALNAPSGDIHADLRLVLGIVDTFRSNFLQAGNPTGTNAEITAALTGRNKLRLSLIPADHLAINPAGELCDRWGTPFFFHAESATRMEIRSAGPDRKMWNDDDVVISP
jgi:hypothetical protein